MKKNHIVTILALLLCCCILCACGGGKKTESVSVSTAAPVQTPAPTPVPQGASEAEQRSLIERSRSVWLPSDSGAEPWYYAVTDLDHNGRYEVITASLQGTGLYTWVKCWEVSADYSSLNPCPDNTGEGEGWPDLIVDTLPSYRDPATGRCSYVCEDLTRDGAARYYHALEAFSLVNGRLELRTLASMEELYDSSGAVSKHYYNAAGSPVSQQDYESAADRVFQGQEQGTLSLSWTQLELQQAQPTPQPQLPVQTQQPYQPIVTPAPQQTYGPVTITKNPTGETVNPGGRTWFIAHAENATSLTWILTSPQGQVFNLGDAMAANPGLSLEALEQDTLAVSNIPKSLDGWSVQARFDGPAGSAVTAPALIRVEDSAAAYAEPLSKYFYALQHQIADPSYAYENNISEYFTSVDRIGYALLDLDGDGTQELLVGGVGANDYAKGILFDLYTLRNGAPVQLACSSARNRYYLRSDYSILNEGSGGAGHTAFILSSVRGGQLVPEESVFTFFDNGPTDGWYHQTDGYTYEPRAWDEQLTEETFNFYVRNWEAAVITPELTPLG